MSSRRGGEKLSSAGASDPSPKGNTVAEKSSPGVDQLSQGVAGVSLDAGQDDGWEVYAKKSKNKAGNSGGKQWGPQYSTSKAWVNPDTFQKLGMRSNAGSGKGSTNAWPTLPAESKRPAGRGNGKTQLLNHGYDNNPPALKPTIPPPLKNGWGWSTRATSAQPSDGTGRKNNVESVNPEYTEDVKGDRVNDDDDDNDDEDSDVLDESDDDLLSDGFDSDASQKSHETRKKNRWLKELFECLDSLTVEQINDPERQWHCPACKGGPGAIDWYRGLQPLITHAKTKGSIRVKLHRELAELLDEELRRKGTSVIPAGEMFGKWKGLDGVEKEIVWPPMVIIMNTRHDKDENEKWIGMGNQELLDYFSSYAAVRARHSYGPQGHRGMSVLIFEPSAVGYLEAERLSKDFEDNGRDRAAWDSGRVAFYPGGRRQLYGYIAEKKDMDYFNHHSQGKSKLKFEMKSYQEVVVNQLKQMSDDNQLLIWFKNKVAKQQVEKKAIEESFGIVSEKLRKTSEENRIVRERTKMHHEQNKEEMDFQEQFFKDQLKGMRESRKAKEENFDKIQQEELEKVKQSQGNPSSVEDRRRRAEEIQEVIECQHLEMEFVAEKEKLVKSHEEKMLELKRRHWQEEVAVEEEFDAELAKLMEKYTPGHSELINT